MVMSEILPYSNIELFDCCIRTFSSDIDESELKWHFDDEDRTVTILEGNDWKFQLDNQLPIELKKNSVINIDKGVYHRIIKGTSHLVVKIKKHGIN